MRVRCRTCKGPLEPMPSRAELEEELRGLVARALESAGRGLDLSKREDRLYQRSGALAYVEGALGFLADRLVVCGTCRRAAFLQHKEAA